MAADFANAKLLQPPFKGSPFRSLGDILSPLRQGEGNPLQCPGAKLRSGPAV
jgi:hypothetical protein